MNQQAIWRAHGIHVICARHGIAASCSAARAPDRGTPGYVVRGKGVAASLNSASHGAGRRMSRKRAKELFSWDAVQVFLRERKCHVDFSGPR